MTPDCWSGVNFFLDHFNFGVGIAALGTGRGEAHLHAAGTLKFLGRRFNVAVEVVRPDLAEVHEQCAAVVVVIRQFAEDDDGVDLFFAFDGSFGEIEADDGQRLADDLIGVDLGAANLELGAGENGLCNFSEIHNVPRGR